MGAAGITVLMVALLFGWEALQHFRKAGAALANNSSTSASGGASTTASADGSPSPTTSTPTTSQPGTSTPTTSSQPGYQQASKVDIQNIITAAQRMGIDPNAFLALIAWESDNFNVKASGDNGTSLGLTQIHLPVWPISRQCALDAACNIQFWESNFGPTARRLWDALGGQNSFNLDPNTFLQRWVPAVQVSDPWDGATAATALARVRAIRQQYGV